MHSFAQIRLGQACGCGVDGGERVREFAACCMKTRVHHGAAHETAADFTAQTQTVSHCQRFLLRGVEVEKPQSAGVGTIVYDH